MRSSSPIWTVCIATKLCTPCLIYTKSTLPLPLPLPDSEEEDLLVRPALLRQRLVHALLQRLRPANQHHRPVVRAAVFPHQRRVDPAPQARPARARVGERVDDFGAGFVAAEEGVEVVLAEDVADEAVAVEDGAARRVGGVPHDGAEDLEDGGDAAAAADHGEFPDGSLGAVDAAAAAADVLEFADRAFEVDAVADGEGVHGLAHLTAGMSVGGEVEFDEDVQVAFAGYVGDGSVGTDDGFAVDGVAEADHQVLADR